MKKGIFELSLEFFIKRICKTANVVFEEDYKTTGLCCEPTEDTIYIGLHQTEIEDTTFMELVEEIEPTIADISPFTLGILHELGHFYTHDEELEEQYNVDINLLVTLQEQGLISETDQNKLYVRLELERLATEWACEFAKAHSDWVRAYDKTIVELKSKVA